MNTMQVNKGEKDPHGKGSEGPGRESNIYVCVCGNLFENLTKWFPNSEPWSYFGSLDFKHH